MSVGTYMYMYMYCIQRLGFIPTPNPPKKDVMRVIAILIVGYMYLPESIINLSAASFKIFLGEHASLRVPITLIASFYVNT